MLAVERGAALVFSARNPLKRCKIELAKGIVLITEQTPSFPGVFYRFGPDVHHLAAYERLDPISTILG
jgi:hypothetical protein